MKIKQISTIVLAAVLCISAAGCENGEDSSSDGNDRVGSSFSETGVSESDEIPEAAYRTENHEIKELSDDLMDFQVSVNGNVITFPCATGDLIDAGFKLERNYVENSLSGKKVSVWFTLADITMIADVYNLSDTDYNLSEESPSVEDVVVTGGMISGDFSTADIVLAKDFNLNGATSEKITATYGTADIDNGFGTPYYCGDHYNGDIIWNRYDLHLHHTDETEKECNQYFEFIPNDYSEGIKSIVFASDEKIVDSFYEKFPDQIKK